MDDILAYLEELTHPDSQPPEYFALLDKVDPYSTAILERFSLSFLDELTEAYCGVSGWLETQAFSRGFRLGVRLMLAARE